MSLRARIFLIISVVVLVILAVSIFLVVRNRNKDNQTPAPSGPTSTVSESVLPAGQLPTEIPAGMPVKTATPLEAEKNGVEQLAKVFVERYGTYSTDNLSQNVKEAQDLVTKSLWAEISVGLNAPITSRPFYGITTKVMGTDLTSWTATKAMVSLRTRRTEDKDNGAITTRSQNVTVEMVKEGGVWLANDIVWN